MPSTLLQDHPRANPGLGPARASACPASSHETLRVHPCSQLLDPSGQGGSGGRCPGQAGRARGSEGEHSGAGGWRARRGPISTPLPGCTLLPSPAVKHANLPESWVGKGEQPKASSGCVTTSSENSAFPLLETSRGGWERPAPRGGEKGLEFPRCRLGLF